MKTTIKKILTAVCTVAMSAFTLHGQTLLSEDFEGIAVVDEIGPLPDGWIMYSDNLTNMSGFTQFGTGWVVSQVETHNKAAASVSGTTAGTACDRWLVTPGVMLPDATYKLSFRAYGIDASEPERLRIAVSTTGVDKENFTVTLADYTFDGSNGATDGWNHIELPLGQFAGQTVHIAFINHGSSYFLFVDDVKVTAVAGNLHMALLENFTSSYCGNCPAGHTHLEGAYEGLEDRVAWVSHHAGFQNDAMTIPESVQLEALYGTNTYAPAMMIDRDMRYSTGNPGPVHMVDGATTIHYQLSQATSQQDPLVLVIDTISCEGGELRVSVFGQFLSDMQLDHPRLALYLCEDSVIGLQSNGYTNNTSYRHDHVIRASLTNVWGDAGVVGSTAAGSTFRRTYTYNLPATVRPEKCYLVAFVAHYGSSVTSGRSVVNTTKSGYITDDSGRPVAIDDVQQPVVALYPNPAVGRLHVSAGETILSLSVTTLDGRCVMDCGRFSADEVDLDISSLPAGLYIVTVTTPKAVVSQKVMVR